MFHQGLSEMDVSLLLMLTIVTYSYSNTYVILIATYAILVWGYLATTYWKRLPRHWTEGLNERQKSTISPLSDHS